jgi:predicted DCC family thiol-disulfide oxidoreductase YuxK
MSSTSPTLVYDGDCGICRDWVSYWEGLTGDRITYRPYQEAASDFPGVPREAFAHAIQLIEADGQVYSGAAATYRVLRHAPGRAAWWWLYEHLPGFSWASERAYTFLARRRDLLASLTRVLWGRPLEPEHYELVSWLFLRLLGAIYVAAFASLAVQIRALVGRNGILPLDGYLDAAHRALGDAAYGVLPTLFWLNASDTALIAGAVVGVVLGLLVIVGWWTRPALIGLFALYLSYVIAGQDFMSFQWDTLLLETGFLAIFLTGGSRIVVWLYRCLVFRYFLLAGAVKLLSGDSTWRDLTALEYHFWTQPLPTPLAWYTAQLPQWLLVIGTGATLAVELGCVFLIFLPRRPRAAGGCVLLLFQSLIVLTGNYNFFNLLSMSLCIFLFDDAALRHVIPKRLASWVQTRVAKPGRAATTIATALALVVVPVGVNRIWETFTRTELPLVGIISSVVSPLLIVNAYGLFAVMTTERPEIVIEGSTDGHTWTEYVFAYKPGPLARPPLWNIPHQPRLDWQMWFAALNGVRANLWFPNLMLRLLQGSPPVLALFASNPFPRRPPNYVRAVLYEYRFADPGTHAATGQWWVREPEGLYFPQVSLADFGRASGSGPATQPDADASGR